MAGFGEGLHPLRKVKAVVRATQAMFRMTKAILTSLRRLVREPGSKYGRAACGPIRNFYCTTSVTVAFRVAEPEVAVTVTT